jgi:hypothetical protein
MSTPADFLVFLAGLFLYGMKGIIGRWLVTITFKVLKKLYVETEHELALFIRAYHEALRK